MIIKIIDNSPTGKYIDNDIIVSFHNPTDYELARINNTPFGVLVIRRNELLFDTKRFEPTIGPDKFIKINLRAVYDSYWYDHIQPYIKSVVVDYINEL